MLETIQIVDTPLKVDYKTITIREVYEALAKNGFRHLRSTWYGGNVFTGDRFLPTAGCVIAQAAFNLGVAATYVNLDVFLDENGAYLHALPDTAERQKISREIRELALDHQLNQYKVTPDSRWYHGGGLSTGLADMIIYWNDKVHVNSDIATKYTLRTYEEVAQMAKELMTPFFDQTVKVAIANRDTGIPLVV